jgi:hypothetical protein
LDLTQEDAADSLASTVPIFGEARSTSASPSDNPANIAAADASSSQDDVQQLVVDVDYGKFWVSVDSLSSLGLMWKITPSVNDNIRQVPEVWDDDDDDDDDDDYFYYYRYYYCYYYYYYYYF